MANLRKVPPKRDENGYGFQGRAAYFDGPNPLVLDSGKKLDRFSVCYTTYGQLNKDKSNAILICHALTGDQFVAEPHPITGKSGWWSNLIGPNLLIDTNRYFVICSNVLGGCMGTTGPAENNPGTGKPWGMTFPMITIRDMVRAQALLMDHLGIDQLLCVVGGSMGGMQVLEWASVFPERVFSAIAIATAPRLSAQNIAFNTVSRLAIMSDPDWRDGEYLSQGVFPSRGLAVARQVNHITYHSDNLLQQKFGRMLKEKSNPAFVFDAEFQIESYLKHQGETFIDRFDANSYLYITRSMDYFDLAMEHGGYLPNAFKQSRSRFCLISFTSDWLFPTHESISIADALQNVGAPVFFAEIASDSGHDAFLLDEPAMNSALSGFLSDISTKRF